MTRQEIRAFFPPTIPIFFGGLTYGVPTVEWLTGAFWTFLWPKLLNYSNRWECRDFARAYACMAQFQNAETPGGPACDALAVGEFWFHPEGNPIGENHAICPALTDQGLVFIEPQTGKLRPTTPNEILSCAFLRF